ncbi:MAG: serine hydroxymethyltransferase [Candidatus Micrarchaeota archaeon]
MDYKHLRAFDPEIADALLGELGRQQNGLELIASENFVSEAVLEAAGSIATNKYAEGYPGKRYYGGMEFIDKIETIAIERAKKLFMAEHANVQPNAGSPANMAAYYALLQPGDTFMGMSLDQGGHLTHGHAVNFSGKLYKAMQYSVDRETGLIDYDQVRKLALEHKPKLILSGYTVYPRIIDFKQFREIADEIGAYAMADIAHIAGLVAAKQHPSPVPYCDIVTTTTHKTLRGPRSGLILCKEKHAKAVDKAVFPGLQGGPLEHIIAAKAVCFKEAMQPEFTEYAKQIIKNAKALASSLMENGLNLVTGGTDNHVMLADVTPKGVSGKQAQDLLEQAGITVNKNMIPYDTRKPVDPSGVRIGTPALTTRGMKESEMKMIGEMICRVLSSPNDGSVREKVKQDVLELCRQFPLYPNLTL